LAAPFGANFETIFQNRLREADEFYARICPPNLLTEDSRNVQRQAFAGLLWSKQFYFYVVYDWLKGDPAGPPPPESRLGLGTRNGFTCSTMTLSPCQINGNIPGMQLGI
jgi:hypothetical protein